MSLESQLRTLCEKQESWVAEAMRRSCRVMAIVWLSSGESGSTSPRACSLISLLAADRNNKQYGALLGLSLFERPLELEMGSNLLRGSYA